jgi:uncharacterized protein with FMN-binding domain
MVNVVKNKSKKLSLSLGLILFFALYTLAINWRNSKIVEPVSTSGPNLLASSTQTLNTSLYRDGLYTGSIEDVYYGNVQVKVTISGGLIVDVAFLDYPKDRDNSVKINTRAMPLLKTETIKSQSAKIDTITGATQTSKGFVRSLTNALDQAKKIQI